MLNPVTAVLQGFRVVLQQSMTDWDMCAASMIVRQPEASPGGTELLSFGGLARAQCALLWLAG